MEAEKQGLKSDQSRVLFMPSDYAPEVLCDSSEANAGEEVDGEPVQHTVFLMFEATIRAFSFLIRVKKSIWEDFPKNLPCVPGIIPWKKSLPAHLQSGVPRSRNKLCKTHELSQFLKEASGERDIERVHTEQKTN